VRTPGARAKIGAARNVIPHPYGKAPSLSASIALSSPAFVRLWRAAVVRRGLCVVGFVGGFLALAFLFGGGSAHADEPAGTHDAQALLTADPVGRALDGLGAAGTSTDTRAPGSPKDALAPVAKSAEQGTAAVTGLVHDLTGVSVPSPVGGGTGGSAPGGSGSTAGHPTVHHRATAHHAHRSAAAGRHTVTGTVHHARTGAARHSAADGSRAANRGRAPLPLPAGPAGRASQSADAAGVQHRGNDAYAALWTTPKPFGLVTGAVRAASAAPLRDRPFEVLELPG
jgi:hypothetical protein